MEPQSVSVIVYGAKGLKPKKKGKHKFSVKFGVGNSKFVTDVVEDLFNNPTWNTESEIEISDSSKPLKLVVLQKDDVLGQVTIPLGDLPTFQRHRQIRAPLQPHKKCPHPEGELVYEAWVSSQFSPDNVSIQSDGSGKKKSLSSGLKKLKGKLSHSPLMARKNRDATKSGTDGNYTFSLANRGAVSCHDLSSFHGNMLSVPSDSLNSLDSDPGDISVSSTGRVVVGNRRKSASVLDMMKKDEDEDESMKPEINGVSPRESPVEGGVKVTIRGENLGLKKEDVIGLYICGSNCLGSLEYISCHKLTCTTKPWKACTGNIVIETASGGKAVSLVEFAFVPSRPSPEEASPVPPSPKMNTSFSSSPSTPHSSILGEQDRLSESGSMNEEPAKVVPAKPPRKLKAPVIDLDVTDSPELHRRSDPFALSSSSNSSSANSSFKRKSLTPQNSPKPEASLMFERMHTPSPKHRRETPSPNVAQTFEANDTIQCENPEPSYLSTPYDNKEETAPSPEPGKPVAEIKPQPTPRKRQAPAPPTARSQSNSPALSDTPNMDIINGKSGNSQFYDISFVDVQHDEEDTPVHSPNSEGTETKTTFYFDREAQNEVTTTDVKKSHQPDIHAITEPKKTTAQTTPIIKPPPSGPSKMDLEEMKEMKTKQRELEIESQKKQEELRRWMDGYKQLQHENRFLKDENDSMKAYIERLVAQVMIRCPDALDHENLHT